MKTAQPSIPDAALDGAARAPRDAKVSHLVAMELRRQILSGELVADRQLATEADLTATFGVSRETVREALRILESQSLVEVRRGRGGGAIVRRPGPASISSYLALLLQLRRTTLADLEEVRAVLEPPLAEQFAVRCTAVDLHVLERLHDEERAAGDDSLAFVMAAAGFDTAVTERSGNRSMGLFAGVFRDIYARQLYAAADPTHQEAARQEQGTQQVIAGHSAFLDAAHRRDGARARKAWADYLDAVNSLTASRGRGRGPINIVPLWRAQGRSHLPGQPARRLATAAADEIRARIAEGRLRDGDRLPALPELAAELGVSRPTLREALRILEMESLISLRAGDRNGPLVRHPSPQMAAQLAGTVIQARQTTLEDFFRATAMIDPSAIELAATRIGPDGLAALRSLADELARSAQTPADLSHAWMRARQILFEATRNPALVVIAEIIRWVHVSAHATIAAAITNDPTWLARTGRLAALFRRLADALEAGDSSRAVAAWVRSLHANSPYIESSELGRLLVVDLVNEKEGAPWMSRT